LEVHSHGRIDVRQVGGNCTARARLERIEHLEGKRMHNAHNELSPGAESRRVSKTREWPAEEQANVGEHA